MTKDVLAGQLFHMLDLEVFPGLGAEVLWSACGASAVEPF